MDGLKKRLCNPPANRIAGTGDHEVLGMFEGAGDGLAFALEDREQYEDAIHEFERSAVTIEAEYVAARKRLAADTVARMHEAFGAFAKATGGEVYGGG